MMIGNRVAGYRVWATIVAIIVVLTFLLPPFYGCGTKGEFLVAQLVKASEGATISSSDKKITLEIPPDALKKDTRVTLSVVPEEEWSDDIREMEPLGAVYRLEPDGIELDKPATLTIRLEPDDLTGMDLPEGAFPLCIALTRSDDGEWDILNNPETMADSDTGEVLVSGEASHFSEEVLRYTTIAVSFEPEEVQASIYEGCWPIVMQIRNFGREKAQIGAIEYYCSGPVEKCMYADELSSLDLLPGETESVEMEFNCGDDGYGYYGSKMLVKTSISASIAAAITGSIDEAKFMTESDPRRKLLKEGYVWVRAMRGAMCEDPVVSDIPEPAMAPERPKGQVACKVTFNPDLLDFGNVCVGTTKQMRVTVTNNSNCNVAIAGYEWPIPPFKIVSTVPQTLTLAPGQSYDYNIQFTPTRTGPHKGFFGILVRCEPLGQQHTTELLELRISGTGVACEQQASAISIEGEPSCTPTTAGSQLDLKISVRGQAPIEEVTYYIDGELARSFGDISATEWPPSPGMILRRITDPGPHTQCVKAVNVLGQDAERCWETYCSEEPTSQPLGAFCPFCGYPIDQCICPK